MLRSTLSARELLRLSLHNCTSFSASALRHMVESRQSVAAGFSELAHFLTPSLSRISVTGCAPKISEEDKEWLMANLELFNWHPLEEV
jgi:hypothetical protein